MDMTKKKTPGKPPHLEFGKDLTSLREAAGLTKTELSRQSAVDPKTLRDLEAGKRRPHPDTLRSLATALGITLERLNRSWKVVPLADSLSEVELDGLADRLAERISPKLVRALRDELRRSH